MCKFLNDFVLLLKQRFGHSGNEFYFYSIISKICQDPKKYTKKKQKPTQENQEYKNKKVKQKKNEFYWRT